MNVRIAVIACGILAGGMACFLYLKRDAGNNTAFPSRSLEGEARQIPGGPYQPMDPRWYASRERAQLDPSWEWKEPIRFFGKVTDETETPIADARVDLEWSDLSDNGASNRHLLSDKNGLFRLCGVKGKGLTVRVSKDGYYTNQSSDGADFEFTDFSAANYYDPNSGDVEIFRLRKKGTGIPMMVGKTHIRTLPDGTPVHVNLLNHARTADDGQLVVSAITNTAKYPPSIFNWSATITVPDGGLIENSDEFPFVAPTSGYVSKVQFDFPADSPKWSRVVKKNYYIAFGFPRKFGRIQICFDGGSQDVDFQYWVNPSGSTYLEPDRKSIRDYDNE